METDQELSAMGIVLGAIEPLDDEARARVMGWVSQKLKVVPPSRTGARASPAAGAVPDANEFAEFHQLFDRCSPTTDADRALVGGYWFQTCRGQEDFSSQEVNDELKHLGHPVGNITRAFDHLQSHKPVLARQVQKTGKSKQGRKRYKLTREGVSRVEEMLRAGPAQPEA